MDAEFHKIQQEATHQFNQNLREKEALTDNEHAVGKGLLQMEIRKLTDQLAALNENYDEQIEVSFDLQDQLTTAEEALVTLTETNKRQQKKCDQLTEDLNQQNNRLAATEAELGSTQEQFTELQLQHQRQTALLTTTEEELRKLHLAPKISSPVTPRSGEATPQPSGSVTGNSALHSMIEERMNPTEFQRRSVAELQQELRHITRERDELQKTVERIFENPPDPNADPLLNNLSPSDIPRPSTLPKAAIFSQLTANVPPFTNIMQ